MSWYNYLIVIIPFAIVLYMAFHTRKYIRGIPDFLAGGRICGRYLLAVSGIVEGNVSLADKKNFDQMDVTMQKK